MSGFRIQSGGEMLDGDADSTRGEWYGQGSEGTGEGTKMHLFPSLSVTFSLFRMQIPQKSRDRSCPCSCIVPSAVLYTT